MVALPFLVMVIILALGVPIAFCLAVAGGLGILLTTGWNWSTLFGILSMAPFASVADFTFTTVPMFVLMATPFVYALEPNGRRSDIRPVCPFQNATCN